MTAKIVDEYAGQGGTFIIDPKTGKRKLLEQSQPAKEKTDSALEQDQPAKQKTDPATEEVDNA